MQSFFLCNPYDAAPKHHPLVFSVIILICDPPSTFLQYDQNRIERKKVWEGLTLPWNEEGAYLKTFISGCFISVYLELHPQTLEISPAERYEQKQVPCYDKMTSSLMFYLCFSKAFNTVSPNILLKKDELSGQWGGLKAGTSAPRQDWVQLEASDQWCAPGVSPGASTI